MLINPKPKLHPLPCLENVGPENTSKKSTLERPQQSGNYGQQRAEEVDITAVISLSVLPSDSLFAPKLL